MIDIITKEHEDTLAIRMTGQLTAEDYSLIFPLMEDKIKNHKKVNLYCEIEDVVSVKPGAIWQDLKFDIQHFNHFKRVALVSDKKSIAWLSTLSQPFTTAEVEFYNSDEKAKAMEWVVMNHN